MHGGSPVGAIPLKYISVFLSVQVLLPYFVQPCIQVHDGTRERGLGSQQYSAPGGVHSGFKVQFEIASVLLDVYGLFDSLM